MRLKKYLENMMTNGHRCWVVCVCYNSYIILNFLTVHLFVCLYLWCINLIIPCDTASPKCKRLCHSFDPRLLSMTTLFKVRLTVRMSFFREAFRNLTQITSKFDPCFLVLRSTLCLIKMNIRVWQVFFKFMVPL